MNTVPALLIEQLWECQQAFQSGGGAREMPMQVMACCRLLTLLDLSVTELEQAINVVKGCSLAMPIHGSYQLFYTECQATMRTLQDPKRTQVSPLRALRQSIVEALDLYRADMASGRFNAIGPQSFYLPQMELYAGVLAKSDFGAELLPLIEWVEDEAQNMLIGGDLFLQAVATRRRGAVFAARRAVGDNGSNLGMDGR